MKLYKTFELNVFDLVDFPNSNSIYLRRAIKKTQKNITFLVYHKKYKTTHISTRSLKILEKHNWIKLNE